MLDIDTPKGRVTLDQERRAIEIFERAHPHLIFCESPKDQPASADGVVVEAKSLLPRVVAVVEVKCREMTLDQLQKFDMNWLVTAEKIDKCAAVAAGLGVPFYGFLYLVRDDILLTKLISAPSGFVAKIERKMTTTKRTVNGGTTKRMNAYVDMTNAAVLGGR